MNNYMNYTQGQNYQPYQATQYFPQPQGSIYMINNSNEVANVPVGAGLSAAVCLREGVIYLKTIQNGNSMLLGYRLSPLENNSNQSQINGPIVNQNQPQPQNVNQESTLEQKILSTLENFEARLKKLESPNEKPRGGVNEWPL